MIATPVYFHLKSGTITVEKPWKIVGWCDTLDNSLMVNREGQIALMMHHPEHGDCWQHYPLFDDDERKEAVFVSRSLTQ